MSAFIKLVIVIITVVIAVRFCFMSPTDTPNV